MQPYKFHRGAQPLLVSVPHCGVEIPDAIARRFTERGHELPDTDWYVDRLYEFANDLGASVLSATHSRYVVDLNRSPDSALLYESNPTSPVCPVRTFAGEPIYLPGEEPDPAEVAERVETYWHPYHQCIAEELWRMRSEHGYALLWDAHSILSRLPGLFEGELPDFNLGTRDNASCPQDVAESLLDLVHEDGKYGAVLNGRFKGGYITLAYGRPADRVWAVQLELTQKTYMRETPRGDWSPGYSNVAGLIESLMRRYLAAAHA